MAQPLQRLAHVADGQWGLITRQQAENAGVAWSSLARLAATGALERIAHGVYRVRGGGEPDHLALRAAWLQLDPPKPAWARLDDPHVAVVSHTSAASLYGVGDLRADIHEFTLSQRRQTRRPDVRIHHAVITADDRVILHGLPATRAGRMIGDLLADHVDPSSVSQIVAEVLDRRLDHQQFVADSLAPYAARFGVASGDGRALLIRLLHLAGYGNGATALIHATPS